METTKWSTGTLVALVVGLVVGFLIGWGVFAGNSTGSKSGATGSWGETASSTETGTEGDTTASEASSSDDSTGVMVSNATGLGSSATTFSVNNQVAGPTVNVLNVTTAGSTWVAVRDYQGGKLGNILGARRIDVPSQAGVAVQLLRPTLAGHIYAVVLYRDNGDKLFSSKTDTLVSGELASFMAK